MCEIRLFVRGTVVVRFEARATDISVGMCDLILLWQRVISAYGPKHEHHRCD